MKFKKKSSASFDEDLARGHLVDSLEHNVHRSMLGFVFVASLTTFLFFTKVPELSLIWYVLVVIICVWRICKARFIIRNGPAPIESSVIVSALPYTVVVATVLTSFPAWMTMQTSGLPFAYMTALFFGIAWSASFTNAPIPAVAYTFVITQVGVGIAAAMIAGMTTHRAELAAINGVGTVVALYIARQTSWLFREATEQQLELAQKNETVASFLAAYEEHSNDWLWQTDASFRLVDPSARFAEAFGETTPAIDRRSMTDLLDHFAVEGDDADIVELGGRLQAHRPFKNLVAALSIQSERRWISISGRPTHDRQDKFSGYRGVMFDITEARLAQSRALHLTQHDALTGLPNRTRFTDLLRRALSRERSFVILSLDLDRFKAVNEVFGHPVGDATLVEMSSRLQACVDVEDVVARLGDDEFVVLTWRVEPMRVGALCRRLIEVASQPVLTHQVEVSLGTSIGVAFAPADGMTTDTILNSANQALFRAKNDGRGTFRLFSVEMDRQFTVRQQLLQDLRRALADHELTLYYQPKINAATGAIQACEALLRWHHPTRGMVSPAEFIPLAEESGLIDAIGDWVIGQACHEAATWPTHLDVSVNVSTVQFGLPDLRQRISHHLKASNLAPERLELEVTESVLVDDPTLALKVMQEIRTLGVRIALDDFGTGYSSLSYLTNFPFDRIKIDRVFAKDIEKSAEKKVIVRSIVDIASGLGMMLTAEGIETTEQARYLRDIGCQELQGFLFARPQPPRELDFSSRRLRVETIEQSDP